MSVRWYSVVIGCKDINAQATWWAEALGWKRVYEGEGELEIASADGVEPSLTFLQIPEGKTVKNRLHIDLAPRLLDDQAAEVDRLIAMGATRADIGQGPDVSWVVLADPEGNEFCVLSPRD